MPCWLWLLPLLNPTVVTVVEGTGEGGESDQGAVAPEEDSSGAAPPKTPEETQVATEQPAARTPKCDGSFQDCVTDDGNVCKQDREGMSVNVLRI